MDFIDAVVIGLIEGVTEFLPISSTGHMIVASKFLGVHQDAMTKAYEVVIQFAAILAVVHSYRKTLSIKNTQLWIKLFIAFIPLAAVGYLFKDHIKELFRVDIVAWMFIIGGIIFLVVERWYTPSKSHIRSIEEVGYKEAIWIGIAQVFSLIPGTSRAGATIIGGLLVGLDRKISAEFSFLLAIPVMLAVSGYDLVKHYDLFIDANWEALLVGFIVAFFTAYLTIWLFLAFLQRFSFVAFGIYRIAFGILLLTIL